MLNKETFHVTVSKIMYIHTKLFFFLPNNRSRAYLPASVSYDYSWIWGKWCTHLLELVHKNHL